MAKLRKPYIGVLNVIRFNWPMYVAAIIISFSLFISNSFHSPYSNFILMIIILIIIVLVTSLVVSYYIYDYSSVYDLNWLNGHIDPSGKIANIHAGFDETSQLLLYKYPKISLIMLDFYDPIKHTEHSIRRAREIYPIIPGTQHTNTNNITLPDSSLDTILVIFSAHEIRNILEREIFFKELQRIAKPTGKIIVTEHTRDWRNFLAYNIGFFHFYTKSSWQTIIKKAELYIDQEFSLTPFIVTFICRKNGNAS